MVPVWQRLCGAALLLVTVLIWRPDNPLWLTIASVTAFVLGAYWLTGALFAVYMTVALVAWCHLLLLNLSETAQGVYLATAVLSSVLVLHTLVQRFRQRIIETRAARWQNRGSDSDPSDPQ